MPAGASSAATTAPAASSSHSVGRYASRGPMFGEIPARACSTSLRVRSLSGPTNRPKRRTTVSPPNCAVACSSAVSAVAVRALARTGAASSIQRSPPSS
jgi:hypothetical protein